MTFHSFHVALDFRGERLTLRQDQRETQHRICCVLLEALRGASGLLISVCALQQDVKEHCIGVMKMLVRSCCHFCFFVFFLKKEQQLGTIFISFLCLSVVFACQSWKLEQNDIVEAFRSQTVFFNFPAFLKHAKPCSPITLVI